MLPKIPGRLGGVAQRVASAAQSAKPAKSSNPRMDIMKKQLDTIKNTKAPQPLRNRMPLEKIKKMPASPIKKMPPSSHPQGKVMPEKAKPVWQRSDYKPGDFLKGYTKYA